MKKIIFIILLFIFSGCIAVSDNPIVVDDEPQNEQPNKDMNVEVPHMPNETFEPFIEDNILHHTSDSEIENIYSNAVEPFYPDLESLHSLYPLPKDEVLKRLGSKYEIVMAGAEGLLDGYFYEEYGITIVFLDERWFWGKEELWDGVETIIVIDCTEKIEINGAKVGMTFSEILKYLPNSSIYKDINPSDPAHPVYYMIWEYENINISFGAIPYWSVDNLVPCKA